MNYNWQQPDWKDFRYDTNELEEDLLLFIEKAGELKGLTSSLTQEDYELSVIKALTTEAIKNAEIEGEILNKTELVSSIKKNLGFKTNRVIRDNKSEGMANLVSHVLKDYQSPLTKKELFNWHQLIFPNNSKLTVGAWRKHQEPMQIVSGAIGRETIHFEAPPSTKVEQEMQDFINWFNDTAPNGKNKIIHAPIRSGIAQLYFESIHPFEDGNGRIGRAIAEKAVLQTVNYPLLFSLSSPIESDRKKYYEALKNGQQKNETTDFLRYFLSTLIEAIDQSKELIRFTIKKGRFFSHFKSQLNERQLKVVTRMLEEGTKKIKGGMTATKYMKIAKTSKPTATRDIQQLKSLGILIPNEKGGRSTSYSIDIKTPS